MGDHHREAADLEVVRGFHKHERLSAMAWRSKSVAGRTWSVFSIAARKRSSSGDKSPRLPIAFLKRGLPLMMMTTETKGGDGVGRAKCQVKCSLFFIFCA
jgi:hypothetical protein